jgi:D-ornithine 4,5-aminomutase subunit alpha
MSERILERGDDYTARRAHLAGLSEAELEGRFHELTMELTGPMIELAKKHTSPSIERSVLLRMGFNSLEAAAIVEACLEMGLLGKGAGHVVLRAAAAGAAGRDADADYLEAGRRLAAGELRDEVKKAFAGGRV